MPPLPPVPPPPPIPLLVLPVPPPPLPPVLLALVLPLLLVVGFVSPSPHACARSSRGIAAVVSLRAVDRIVMMQPPWC